MAPLSLAISLLLGLATAQTPGWQPEIHPKLETWKCTTRGGCVPQNTFVVLDDLSHPIHQKLDTALTCGSSAPPNATVCPNEVACAENCIVEGISDYAAHGLTTSGSSLNLHILEKGVTVSPRAYLLQPNGVEYEMLKLTGNELSFDVDVSKLPCGMNGALYLSEMSESGGRSSLNPGGAAYGTGYCDAQCAASTFINGVGNIDSKGACCSEMDIWEANAYATALTPHPCNHTGLYECTGAACTFDGVCDQWGCSNNPYIEGNAHFYGPGPKVTVDTTKTMTVVTQFPTFPNGTLKQIRRLYVQNGRVIQNAYFNVSGEPDINYIDADYCAPSASRFVPLGGMKQIGEAMERGMVLIFSIWWDPSTYMTWLDSGTAGPCNATEGDPTVIESIQPDPAVTFSNIKWGEIGSTYDSGEERGSGW